MTITWRFGQVLVPAPGQTHPEQVPKQEFNDLQDLPRSTLSLYTWELTLFTHIPPIGEALPPIEWKKDLLRWHGGESLNSAHLQYYPKGTSKVWSGCYSR